MTLANRDPDTIAARLRRHGTPVDEPRADNLREELLATLDRIRAGEHLSELSRRDPEALCALAMERPLTEHEARMLFGAVCYRDRVSAALEHALDAERSWARCQRENADAWGRECAGLGKAIRDVAEAAGVPHLVDQHELLAAAVQYLAERAGAAPVRVAAAVELARPQSPWVPDTGGATLPRARPADATTAALTRASDELTALRHLARCVAQQLGQPGLEEEPETLLGRLGEYLAELRADAAYAAITGDPREHDPSTCDGGPGCPWSPYYPEPTR